MKSWTFSRSLLRLIWLIIAIIIWQALFTSGQIYGFYWLSVAVEKFRCFLPLITALALFGFGIAWIHQWVRGQARYRLFRQITGALALLLILLMIVPTHGGPRHLNSTQIDGHTVHLATHYHFGLRFALYDCDRTGQLCQNVFVSGERYLPFSELVTSFTYDEARRELTVNLIFKDKIWEIIYVYSLAE